ncbi:MAG: hypothetical protein HFH74_16020 [Lachnospiraceae bacterium]|jgi:serine/threonine protein phosphatase PrpC|nr:hypothetical protein [Lachnospiraceae bacterium]
MRKQNSEFLTAFTSEASNDIKNTDYFGYVELDQFACYVIADGIDDQLEAVSARLAVSAAVSAFSEDPSMQKKTLRRCLKAANQALITAKSKLKLKASLTIVITDYVRIRYGQAGNIRLRLYRDGFVKEQSLDQSLAVDLAKADKISQDKVAQHEERNNLYTYLGQERNFSPYISKKIKLTNTDVIALYTRDVWEHIDEGELKDVFADATDKPEETVANIEDLLLSRQPEDLRKYTLAVVFVNKIYQDPNKRRKMKKIIIAIVVVLVVIALVIVLVLFFQKRRQGKIANMQKKYMDTIEYIQMNNYVRAQECCNQTADLAQSLHDKKMQTETGICLKLIEAVIAADELMSTGEYSQAQSGYREAAIRARYADNLGLDYINDQLARTAGYISVYDYIYLGDSLAEKRLYDAAEEKYLEARAQAARLYFDKGRDAAVSALDKLYEDKEEEKAAKEEERQEQLAAEDSAANYVTQGDTAYAQGDYESAKVHYVGALQKYEELGDEAQKEVIEGKLAAAEEKCALKETQAEEAQDYTAQAAEAMADGAYTDAKKYYLLARDIYAGMKDDDKVKEIERKMELLDMKKEEAAKAKENVDSDLEEATDQTTEPVESEPVPPALGTEEGLPNVE